MLLATFSFFACERKSDQPAAQLISGVTSKTWYPDEAKTAGGDNENLSSTEKKENWVFYSNGTMSMNLSTQAMQGRWSYDEGSKTLTITPDGSTTARSFTVTKLDEDDMKLSTSDGSVMELETRD